MKKMSGSPSVSLLLLLSLTLTPSFAAQHLRSNTPPRSLTTAISIKSTMCSLARTSGRKDTSSRSQEDENSNDNDLLTHSYVCMDHTTGMGYELRDCENHANNTSFHTWLDAVGGAEGLLDLEFINIQVTTSPPEVICQNGPDPTQVGLVLVSDRKARALTTQVTTLTEKHGHFETEKAAAHNQEHGYFLPTPIRRTGRLTTLLVRITATDAQPSYTAKTLSDRVFGTTDHTGMDFDLVNTASIYQQCSHDQLHIVPAANTPDPDAPGVVEVRLPIDIIGTHLSLELENAVTMALFDQHGLNPYSFDLHMYAFPFGAVRPNTFLPLHTNADGTAMDTDALMMSPWTSFTIDDTWGAYAYQHGGRSVYNGDMVLYPSYTVHEIGHNLDFGHSEEGTNPYGDGTCMMGGGKTDLFSHEGPRKCFNAAKSWKAGWYSDYHIDLEVSDLPWSGKLSSFTNPAVLTEPDSPDRDNLVIRFDKDTYLMWNRAEGMNEGTQEKQNQVVVVTEIAGADQSSFILASLSDTEPEHKIKWKDTNDFVVFEFCETVTGQAMSADYVQMSIHLQGQPSACGQTLQSLDPNDYEPVASPTEALLDGLKSEVSPHMPCKDPNQFRLTLLLTTDHKPTETSWGLTNADKSLLRSVPTGTYTVPGKQYTYMECLDSAGDYHLDIMDAGHDGLEDPGGFEILRNGVNIRCGSGAFGSIDRTYIHPTTCPEEGYIPVEIDIFTDNSDMETSYRIETEHGEDPAGSVPKHSFQIGGGPDRNVVMEGPLEANMRDHIHGCFPKDGCHIFMIFDKGEDGLCCDKGVGHWSIRYHNKLQVYSHFVGGSVETVEFGDGCDNPDEGILSHGGVGTSQGQQTSTFYDSSLSENGTVVSRDKKTPDYPNDKRIEDYGNDKKIPDYGNDKRVEDYGNDKRIPDYGNEKRVWDYGND